LFDGEDAPRSSLAGEEAHDAGACTDVDDDVTRANDASDGTPVTFRSMPIREQPCMHPQESDLQVIGHRGESLPWN
jgi:hypothetical protein